MKTKLLLTILFAFIYCAVNAQVQKQSPSNTIKKFTTGIKTPLPEVKFKGLYNPPSVDLKWKPILKNQVPENDIIYDEKLEALKKENGKIKKQWEEQGKRLNSEKSIQAVTPVVGVNYLGNTSNGCPPDNSIAISNGGIIVATANSTIEYDNTSGTNLYYNDLEGAAGFFGNSAYTSICDANVLYDSGSDRFIMVTQTCHPNLVNSEVIICFSQTNNPQSGWWVYSFNGDVLSDGSGFDFPRIAVSNNEVYVSGNLFYHVGGFNQTCLFQMTKSVGYAGGTYNATNSGVWSGIDDGNGNPSFTLVPVQYGQQGNYGPGVYLVSNESAGGSDLFLYDLTDDISGSPALNAYSIPTTTYYVGSNAYQLGSSDLLDLRDIRMLSAFYLNGIVHCVFHSRDPSTPYNGINYNRINVSAGTNQSSMLSLSGYDYSYPYLASYATTITDKSVMIGFLRSGSSIYPQERVVNCDNAMVWSGSTLVKAGSGPVTSCYQGSPVNADRWGDYTRIARKNNSSTPSVWMSAQYGGGTGLWATWIAEIHDSGPTGIAEPSPENNLTLYPNPVSSNFVIEFTLPESTDLKISIIDAQGKLVKELFKGTAAQGENIFSFNKSNLRQGIYFLIIQNNKETIKNEKIIITD